MNSMSRSWLVLAMAGFTAFGTGCPSSGGTDGGTVADSGVNPDAGTNVDAGSGADAGNNPDSGNDTDAGIDAGNACGGAPITGTFVIRFVTDGGVQDAPQRWAAFPNALVALAASPCADGGFVSFSPVDLGDGGWQITGVPDGSYYLRAFGTYYATSSRSWDLGYYALGRASQASSDAGTVISLTTSNLAAWTTTDDLELSSANAGLGSWSANAVNAYTGTAFESNGPDAGATKITGGVLDYQSGYFPAPLIEASRGDWLTVTQLATRLLAVANDAGNPPVPYQGASRALQANAFNMNDGTSTSLSGAMVALGQSTTSLSVKASEFENQGASVNPQVLLGGLFGTIDVQPFTAAYGPFSSTPDLVEASAVGVGIFDQTLSLQHGNPYPASWPLLATVGEYFYVPEQLPDAGQTVYVVASSYVSKVISGPDAGSIAPTIAPVGNFAINGTSAFADLVGVSTMPTLTWAAPSTANAKAYYVTISQLGAAGAQATATVATSSTSLRIPPGVLVAGQVYSFTVTADANAALDVDHSPLLSSYPDARSAVVSGVMTP